jgi:hypothetical protein
MIFSIVYLKEKNYCLVWSQQDILITPSVLTSNEFIFSLDQKHLERPEYLYVHFAISFAKTLDRIGMGNREDGNEIRREIYILLDVL